MADGRSGNIRVTCKTRAIDVYLWPHGHPYVDAFKFPAHRSPSLTVYRRGSVATRAFLFFLSARASTTRTPATSPRTRSRRAGREGQGGPRTRPGACAAPFPRRSRSKRSRRAGHRRGVSRPPRRFDERAHARPDRGEELQPDVRHALLQGDAGSRRRLASAAAGLVRRLGRRPEPRGIDHAPRERLPRVVGPPAERALPLRREERRLDRRPDGGQRCRRSGLTSDVASMMCQPFFVRTGAEIAWVFSEKAARSNAGSVWSCAMPRPARLRTQQSKRRSSSASRAPRSRHRSAACARSRRPARGCARGCV